MADNATGENQATQTGAWSETAPQQSDQQACLVPGSAALDRIVEALLLASESALSVDQLLRLLADDSPKLDRSTLRAALATLAERLHSGASELVEVAGGWRLQIRAEFNPQVARLWQEKPPRLSRAMLETLALIVYRQPITRGEIEQVRGVSVSGNIIRTLLEREWIRELGHKEVPGRPVLYGSTGHLLDDLGLKSLSQLPELPEIKDIAQLEAALQKLGISTESLPASAEQMQPPAQSPP